MNLIFISTLYPSSVEPTRATYNRSLMTALARQWHEVSVIAPIMWCPLVDSLRRRTCPPDEEVLDGISVTHPRVFYTPGMFIDKHYLSYRRTVGRALVEAVRGRTTEDRETESAACLHSPVLDLQPSAFSLQPSPVHVMLGFIYPDAVAMAPVCRELGLPYSIRVNGSDFRVRTKQPRFREMVMQCLHEAPVVFCPGQALKRDMVAEGIAEEKIVAFNNGVDRAIFHP